MNWILDVPANITIHRFIYWVYQPCFKVPIDRKPLYLLQQCVGCGHCTASPWTLFCWGAPMIPWGGKRHPNKVAWSKKLAPVPLSVYVCKCWYCWCVCMCAVTTRIHNTWMLSHIATCSLYVQAHGHMRSPKHLIARTHMTPIGLSNCSGEHTYIYTYLQTLTLAHGLLYIQ